MVFFTKKKNKAKENSLSGVFAFKMVVGKIWSFNLFLKLHISYLVLGSQSSISWVLAVFYLSEGCVHLTACLAFFIRDDILTTGVLTKWKRAVYIVYL